MAPINNTLPADPTTKFLYTVLKHCEQIKPNWQEVATESGISLSRNAAGKFRGIVEKAGYKYENHRIIDPNGDGGEIKAKTPAAKTSSTPKTSKKRNSEDDGGSKKASSKKQKKGVKDGDEEDSVVPEKDEGTKDEVKEDNSVDELGEDGEEV